MVSLYLEVTTKRQVNWFSSLLKKFWLYASRHDLILVTICLNKYQDFQDTLDELGNVSSSEFEIPGNFDDQVVVF